MSAGISQDSVEGHNVAQGHLQRLIFGEFIVLTPLRNHFAEAVECGVQALHPLPLASVGRHPPPHGILKLLWVSGVQLRP